MKRIVTKETLRKLVEKGKYNFDNYQDYKVQVYDFSFCFEGSNLKEIPPISLEFATTTEGMFKDCKKLEEIKLLNTEKVSTMTSTFKGCKKLKKVEGLDTKSVSKMQFMFADCINLEVAPEIDLQEVQDVGFMFRGCKKLEKIRFKNKPKKDFLTNRMFESCPKLPISQKVIFLENKNPNDFVDQVYESMDEQQLKRLLKKYVLI